MPVEHSSIAVSHDETTAYHGPSLARLLNQAPEFAFGGEDIGSKSQHQRALSSQVVTEIARPSEPQDERVEREQAAAVDACARAFAALGWVWLPPSQ